MAIDTLKLSRDLEQAGFSRDGAEKTTRAIAGALDQHAATKSDLSALGVTFKHETNLLGERLAKVETRLDGVEVRLDGLDGKFDGLDAKFNELNGKFKGLDAKFDGLDAKFYEHDGKFNGLDAKFNGMGTNFAELGSKFDGLAANHASLETKLNGVDTRLTGEIAKLRTDMVAMGGDLRAAIARSGYDLTWRMLGIAGLIVAAIKLLPSLH